MKHALAALLLTVPLALAPALRAQDAPIRVETRLVEVEVVVRSSQGPVEDLKISDFTVYDKGRRQTITGFALKQQSDSPVQRPLSPTAASNRLYRDQGRPIAPTVILFDTLNSRPQDMLELRRQLGLYLQRAAPNEPFAIYLLNKELTVVQDFTQDLDRLRRVVARWIPTHSTDLNLDLQFLRDLLQEGAPDAMNAQIENVLREVSSMSYLRRADLTAFAFTEIAGHLSGIPGRKKLLWIGGSFPAQVWEVRNLMFGGGTDVRNYSRLLNDSIEALNEAQVAVYPMDVRNPAYDPMPSSQLGVASRGAAAGGSLPNSGQRDSGIDTLNMVAGATGGKAFYAMTDTAGAIEQVMEDAVVTYQIAFTPSERDLDGKYHEIKVEVRRKGLDVRHRKGYLASENKPPTPVGLQDLMRHALEAPLDVTGVGLAADPIARAPGQPRQYQLRLDARDLEFDLNRTARITMATFYPDSSLSGTNTNLDLVLTEARLKEVLANGYIGRIVIEHPEAAKVRIAVLDRSTGRVGTLTVKLTPEAK